jgi:hypothetical protein
MGGVLGIGHLGLIFLCVGNRLVVEDGARASRQERRLSLLSAASGWTWESSGEIARLDPRAFRAESRTPARRLTYSENAVTGQRSCHWDGNAWGHINYAFMRSGDVSYGPLSREVY